MPLTTNGSYITVADEVLAHWAEALLLLPPTKRPERNVGQAVISNLMAQNGDIHFDCAAPHATTFTYLHQAPGASAFVVVEADTREKVAHAA